MTWRLDQLFTAIYDGLGLWCALAGAAILAFAVFAPIVRAMGLAFLLLIASQTWWLPTMILGRTFRWWAIFIVCARGLSLVSSIRAAREPGIGRFPVTVLGGLALGSALWSHNPEFAFGTAVSFLLMLVATFGVVWRLMDVLDIGATLTRGAMSLGILIVVSCASLTAAFETTGSRFFANAALGGRYGGVFINPNMLGLMCMMLIPFVVSAREDLVGAMARFRIPLVVALATCVFLSGSRSAVIGTTTTLILLFMYRYGIGALFIIAAGALALWVAVTLNPVENLDETGVGHITRTKHIETLSGRVELWQQGIDAVRGNELVGLGWSGSRLLWGADAEAALDYGFVRHSSNLHSAHIQILVDLGYTGLVLFWIVCAQTLAAGWSILRQPRAGGVSPVVVVLFGFVASLGDTFVHGSVFSTGSPSAIAFWASSAIVIREAARIRARAKADAALRQPAAEPRVRTALMPAAAPRA